MRILDAAVVILVSAFMASGAPLEAADTSPPAITPPPLIAPPSESPRQPNLDSLRAEIAELRKKVEKPPKDTWDKLAAMSGFVSGIIVVLIGFYATNVYNRRQKASEDRRKDQEVLISQIQTIEKFIPHLSSENEQTKGAALIAIAALG